jgi:hypothetical protein
MTNKTRSREKQPEPHSVVLRRLVEGGGSAVFVDDSGLPGKSGAPPPLDSDRKTWAAVFIPKDRMAVLVDALEDAVEDLGSRFQAMEFHACDIFNGKKGFRDLSVEQRLEPLAVMAELIEHFELPILVQSFDATTLATISGRLPPRAGMFSTADPAQAALAVLLGKVRIGLEETAMHHAPWDILVDEGLYKNGSVMRIAGWERAIRFGEIRFVRSVDFLPLQLADFAAFAVNRMTHLVGKGGPPSVPDKLLMRIAEGIKDHFVNLNYMEIHNLDKLSDYRDKLVEMIRHGPAA